MSDFKQAAGQAATKYGLNPTIFQRQIGAESGFQLGRVSPSGARGVAQIMPTTAKGWGVNPDDPYAALDAAAKHMAQFVKQYGGYRNALVAYNAGPGKVGGKLPAETVAYINKILGPGGSKGVSQVSIHETGGYLPASTKTDESGAAIQALLAHAQSPGSSLLQSFVRNLDSGLYTSKTPGQPVTTSIPGQDAQSPAGVQGLVSRANKIDAEHLPYAWGGGHGPTPAKPGVPLDCSGAVSRLFGVNPLVSGAFAKWGAGGRGKNVTVWANATHVLVEINGKFWGTSASNPGGGAGWIDRGKINTGYLSRFTPRHPSGL